MRQTEALSSKQTNKQFNFHTTWSSLGLGENAKQTVPKYWMGNTSEQKAAKIHAKQFLVIIDTRFELV